MKTAIRPIKVKDNDAIVTLTKGYEAIIDVSDIDLVSGFNWWALVQKTNVYAARTCRLQGKKKTIFMHRAIMGFPETFEIDHKNGNGLYNKRQNLRKATRAQNQHNQRLSSANKSGFKGVFWAKREKKWVAAIRLSGKRHYLGLFADPESAHKAYCAASKNIHAEFGRTE